MYVKVKVYHSIVNCSKLETGYLWVVGSLVGAPDTAHLLPRPVKKTHLCREESLVHPPFSFLPLPHSPSLSLSLLSSSPLSNPPPSSFPPPFLPCSSSPPSPSLPHPVRCYTPHHLQSSCEAQSGAAAELAATLPVALQPVTNILCLIPSLPLWLYIQGLPSFHWGL